MLVPETAPVVGNGNCRVLGDLTSCEIKQIGKTGLKSEALSCWDTGNVSYHHLIKINRLCQDRGRPP